MTPYIYYGTLSPPSLAVRVFAEASGASHTLHSISVATGENRRPEYRKINPLGTVPFMKDGEFELGESGAIMAYVADTQSDKMADHWYPKDVKARAKVNAVMLWHGSTLRSGSNTLLFNRVLLPIVEGVPECSDLVNKYCLPTLHRALKDINDVFLADHDFVAGKDITIADLLLALEVDNLRVQDASRGQGFEELLADYPKVRAWKDRVEQRCQPFYERATRSVGASTAELKKKKEDPTYQPDLPTVEALSET